MAAPFLEDRFYHLFNRGNNHEDIFLEEDNYAYFLRLIGKYLTPIADIYSYCLLPNHFHLILKIKEQSLLPAIIRSGKRGLHQPFSNLFNAYTKAINKQSGRRGSLFQEHLKRNTIETTEYLRNVILYVHLNPSHHGIDNDFAAYNHSSYRSILSDRATLLKRKETIELFDDKENFAFVHQERKIRTELIKEIMDME